MSEPDNQDDAEEYQYQFFSPHQIEVVTAVANRIIPGIDDTPNAEENGVIQYIDRTLVREPEYPTEFDNRDYQSTYNDGIRRLDRCAMEFCGSTVPDLDANQIDDLIEYVDAGEAPGWEHVTRFPLSMTVDEDDFFTILRDHVIEGYYAWPKYGSNENLDSWRAIGYTGPFIEGYPDPAEAKPPWKSFDEIEATEGKDRPKHFHGGSPELLWDPSEGHKHD